MNTQRLFIILLLSILYNNTIGQLPFYNPQIFHTDKNLPQNYIHSIVQDNDGFLWISGRNGIQRFDGSHFQIFQHNPDDSTSIVENETAGIFFDKETNKLWIPTRGSGLSVMDLNTGKCKNYYHHPDRPSKLPNSRMKLVFKDRQKNIWVSANNHGILKYQPETDDFKIYKYKVEEENSSQNLENMTNLIQSYAEDIHDDNILWFGTLSGLLKFNKKTETFERFVFNHPKINFNSINHILTIYPHQNGKLYLGTYLGGISIFDIATQNFQQSTIRNNSITKKQGELDIKKILPKSKNELWITCRTGLGVFNVDSNQSVAYFDNDYFKEQAYGVKFIDNKGRFYTWGLYYKGGDKINKDYLFIFDPTKHQVQNFPYQPKNERRFLLTKDIQEVKNQNKVWVAGDFSEGLYQVDLETGTWTTYPPPNGYFNSHHSFQAKKTLQLQNGKTLVLSNEAIYEVDQKNQKLKRYHLQPNLEDADYRTMIQDSKERIWIGSYFGGLIRINPKNKTIKYFSEQLNPTDLKNHSSAIWTMALDKNDNLWFRASKGFSVYHEAKDTFYHFPYIYNNSKERVGIREMTTDTKGRVWMNTEHFQVVGITDPDHPEKGIIQYLDESDGIKIFKPLSLTADSNGNIWEGKNDFEKINIKTLKVDKYSGAYGINENIWYMNSISDGRVLMGYKKGIGIFHPDSLNHNNEIPKPYLTSFKVFDKELDLEKSLHAIKEINLHPKQNFFSFSFSALGITIPESISFKYKLEGFDDDWVQPNKRRYAAYTNVPFGDYVLKIKASNNESICNENPVEIRIHISRPWYRSGLAYLFYISLFGSLLYSAYFILNRRKELREQLLREKQEAEKLKELDNFKTTFFTNITHEFRTPLTVIQGMAAELNGNERAKQLIQNNSYQLLELVNQLLDISKIDSGSLPMNWEQRNVINYLNYITESLHSFAFSKKISLAFHSESENLNMDFDAKKFQTILINLISNAIKYTPAYGKIIIIGNKKIINENPFLILKISDTGIGIPSATLPYIFDRYFQIERSNIDGSKGTGIGLALVKELTEMHGATIEVKSVEQKGTTFTLLFPITQNANLADHVIPPTIQPSFVSPIIVESDDKNLNNDSTGDLKKLLIIEDNYDVIQYLTTILNNKYEISIAKNGKTGIEKALLEIPDIIVSDVMMPEKDGFQVCATLKQDERTSHIPIILLTAKATTKDKIEGLQFGADAYLMKPFDKEELLVRLEKLIELRKKLQIRFSHFSSKGKDSFLSIEDKFLQKLNKIIDDNLNDESFTTPFLSKKMGMSTSQLYRKLKAITGFSIANYMRYRRLLSAHHLLETTGKSISDIAYECGFSNLSWFNQSFKDTFGYPPNSLRN